MSVKGFKNYDEEGNFLGVEKYDYGSLENIPKNFKNDTYEQDIRQLKTDVEKNVTDHNVSKDAHNDIRLLITEIINRINVIADSDDETLDQMSELVAFIKNNKTLIDSITTSKVNVSDIVNDLTSNVSNKPLSAEQGVVLKTLIDNLTRDLDTHGLSGNHIPTGGTSGQILKWLSSGKAQWANETVYASTTHKHSASDVTSGTLPISRGGTGGTTEREAGLSLGFPSLKNSSKVLGDDGYTDLDTIKTPGTYGCYASGALAKLTNCPTNKKGFVMYVESENVMGSSIYTTQIIRDVNNNVYIRKIRVGVETGISWKRIAGSKTELSGIPMLNITHKGLTVRITIFESLYIGFVTISGKLTTQLETTSEVAINRSVLKASQDLQYLPSVIELPDGTIHTDIATAVIYNESDTLSFKFGVNKIVPVDSKVSVSGVFRYEDA